MITLKKTFVIAICCFFSTTAWGKAPLRVAVFPFKVHSKEKLDYLEEGISNMLLTRMEQDQEITTIAKPSLKEVLSQEKGEMDERLARELGAQVGADFSVLGSLTKIGSGASLDAIIIDTRGEKDNTHVFVQCESMDRVTAKISLLARHLDLKILGKELLTKIAIKGNRYIEEDAIKLALKSKEGNIYSPLVLQEDLKRVYEMGYFSDVQIYGEDSPEGKKVTFTVVERPVVSQIQVQGNKHIKTPEIQKALDIKLGRVLDQNQVRKDVTSIRKLYLDKGYLNAKVDFKLTPSSRGETSVDFYIRENEISKIKKISFSGNEYIEGKKLKKILETREKNLLSFITNAGIFKEEAFQKDLDRIIAFYYNEGHIKATVGNPTVTHEEKNIYITIPIEEGEPFKIGEVEISGDFIVPRETLFKNLKTVKGEGFRSNYLNEDMVGLSEFYSDRGYANVDITPLTNINDVEKTVAVNYEITKGEKIFFERINITGNNRTRDKVIRRELKVSEGELYSGSKIKRSKQRLDDLGFFKKTNLTTTKAGVPNKVILNVEVEEKPTGSLSFGAGYSSVDSLVGLIQLSQDNFLGKGQKLDLRTQLGGTNRFMFSFTEPWLFDTRWKAGADLFSMERWYEDFDSESTGGSIRLGHPLGEFTRVDFGYEYEEVDISDVDYDASLEILEQEGTSTTGAVTAGITRNTLDNRFTPRTGILTHFTTKFAGLGGDNHFVTFIGSFSKYFPLPRDSAFMFRGTIGYSVGYGGEDVPIFEKFFLGGLNSLRGFEERSVGPMERRGDTRRFIDDRDDYDAVGGEKELFFNFEYIFPILKETGIRGVVFFDTGNAYRKSESYFSDIRMSAGFGIRWQSPFGPLRLELGINLDPESKYDEDSSEFHFTMGSMF
ncbi:MAG: outer membrane protein assembly factor BamA [Deltaproteobacteria bacterium]|nr:outer membrane protein assembly factor BamA [Deltaproteobacteria bacterium]